VHSYRNVLDLRFSRLALNVKLLLSGKSHVEYWEFAETLDYTQHSTWLPESRSFIFYVTLVFLCGSQNILETLVSLFTNPYYQA
jgi:hypothetical protein